MTALVVLQPSYLPWLGYFEQMDAADIFVFYDDVQFDKNGWRNRNRIKTAQGAQWLTVPVRQGGRAEQRIVDVEIDNRRPWARKHLDGLRQAYSRAACLQLYLDELAAELDRSGESLADLDITLTHLICGWLGIGTRIERSSRLPVGGDRNGRLVELCRHFGADRYLSGASAESYLDVAAFRRAGIAVEFQDYDHPVYAQLHGEFVSHLSVLDLVLNCGKESLGIIRSGRRWRPAAA